MQITLTAVLLSEIFTSRPGLSALHVHQYYGKSKRIIDPGDMMEGLHTDTMCDLMFGNLGAAAYAENLSRLSQDFVDEKRTYMHPIRTDMKRGFLFQFVLARCKCALSVLKAQELFIYCKELNSCIEGWAFEELVRLYLVKQAGDIPFNVHLRGLKPVSAEVSESWTVHNVNSFNREGRGVVIVGLKVLDKIGNALRTLSGLTDAWSSEEWNFPTLDLRLDGTQWHLETCQDTVSLTHKVNENALSGQFASGS